MNLKTQEAGHQRRWAALPFLLAGACLPVLDTFVISMILPTIRAALGADAVQSQLVASAFSGVYAVFLITGSRLGDLFGRRRLFVVGAAGFTLASLAGALAPSINALIAARAFQGASAALFAPQVLAAIQALFGPSDRPQAIKWMGTAFSIAGALGFLLGGWLIAWHPFGLTWQALFAAYVPLGLAIALGGLSVPESKNPHAQGLDPAGVGLLFLALALVLFPLAEGRAAGWPLWSFGLLALAPLVWVGFLAFERRLARRGGSPLVALDLFREPAFVRGLVLSFFLYVAYGFLFCFALYLKTTRQLSALDLGLANLPFALGFFAVSFAVGRLSAWLGHRILVVGFGLLTLGWSAILTSVIIGGGGLDALGTLGLAVAGVGNGLVLPSLIRVVTGAMEPRHAGLASGVLLSVQQMGSSLGVVILGGIYFSVSASGDAPTAFAWALGTSVFLGAGAAALAATIRRPATEARLTARVEMPSSGDL